MSPTIATNAVLIRWQGVSGQSYLLKRSTNLAHPSFVRIATNVVGQAGMTALADTNAPGCGPFFYRVAVDE